MLESLPVVVSSIKAPRPHISSPVAPVTPPKTSEGKSLRKRTVVSWKVAAGQMVAALFNRTPATHNPTDSPNAVANKKARESTPAPQGHALHLPPELWERIAKNLAPKDIGLIKATDQTLREKFNTLRDSLIERLNCSLSDLPLAMAKMPKLTHIHLSGQGDPKVLVALKTQSQLKNLDLSDCTFSTKPWRALKNWINPKAAIRLPNNIQMICGDSELAEFLDQNTLADHPKGRIELGRAHALHLEDIQANSSAELEKYLALLLPKLKDLTELHWIASADMGAINNPQVLEKLAEKCNTIRELNLQDLASAEDLVHAIQNYLNQDSLVRLNLKGSTVATDTLRQFLSSCHAIKNLNIQNTDISLNQLMESGQSYFSKMETLALNLTFEPDVFFSQLSYKNSRFPALKHLDISAINFSRLSTHHFPFMARSMPALQTLTIEQGSLSSDAKDSLNRHYQRLYGRAIRFFEITPNP